MQRDPTRTSRPRDEAAARGVPEPFVADMTASLAPPSAVPSLPVPVPDPEGAIPLPPELRPEGPFLPPRFHALRAGCYLLRYTPRLRALFPVHYDGTLRVERNGLHTTASGDLYVHAGRPMPWPPVLREPNPAAGIPIFPRQDYRFYLCVTEILQRPTLAKGFTLGFELWSYNTGTRTWKNEGKFTAAMGWTTAPPAYPAPSDYLTGEVKDAAGRVSGELTMGWVSSFLRRAVVEIDKVTASEWPLDNGAGVTWTSIMNAVGWDVTVAPSHADVPPPTDAHWTDAELHAAMLAWRDAANLDREWRYHLMCVELLHSTTRGIMYDAYGGDTNNIPREGAAIASHWVFENAPTWGACAGQRFGACAAPYFRTAVHEIGHAFCLYHVAVAADNHLMQVTPQIAANAAPGTFPANIEFHFSPEDEKRLRHMPDVWVRPGGVPFGLSYTSAPMSPDELLVVQPEGLELRMMALHEAVPIGAPVRVHFTITNVGDRALPVPASLNMKMGHVTGAVIDAAGIRRTFAPVVRYLDELPTQMLEPGQSLSHSLTLLRGAEGALFPAAGVHRVVLDVTWDVEGLPLRLSAETSVNVTAAVDEAHASAAHKILTTPDALLTLALGGDHLVDGIEAVHAGLDHPVLRPHFAFIEARRVGERFMARKANLRAAAELLDENAVLSPMEIRKAATLVRQAGDDAPADAVRRIAKTLRMDVQNAQTDADTFELVRSL